MLIWVQFKLFIFPPIELEAAGNKYNLFSFHIFSAFYLSRSLFTLVYIGQNASFLGQQVHWFKVKFNKSIYTNSVNNMADVKTFLFVLFLLSKLCCFTSSAFTMLLLKLCVPLFTRSIYCLSRTTLVHYDGENNYIV